MTIEVHRRSRAPRLETISVAVDADTLAWVEQTARQTNSRVSDVLRACIASARANG